MAMAWVTWGVVPAFGLEGRGASAVSGASGGQPAEVEPPPPEKGIPPESEPVRGDLPEPESGVLPPLGAGSEDGAPRFFEPRPEDRERVRRFVEEHFPEMARRLRMLETRNPRLFRRHLRQIMPRIVRLMHEFEKDEELGLLGVEEERLEMEVHEAVRAYQEADTDEERGAGREKVERLISEQFDVRQQRAGRTIENLEGRLQRLKRQVERRADSRDEVIAREIETRLNADDPAAARPGRDTPRRPPRPPRERGGR
ncbi:MAG TPA: hypothetical protein VM243_05835 [Phycisphaerae bacterium]|nr:hypothetical protein [Phycisphaerae bacterium]